MTGQMSLFTFSLHFVPFFTLISDLLVFITPFYPISSSFSSTFSLLLFLSRQLGHSLIPPEYTSKRISHSIIVLIVFVYSLLSSISSLSLPVKGRSIGDLLPHSSIMFWNLVIKEYERLKLHHVMLFMFLLLYSKSFKDKSNF